MKEGLLHRTIDHRRMSGPHTWRLIRATCETSKFTDCQAFSKLCIPHPCQNQVRMSTCPKMKVTAATYLMASATPEQPQNGDGCLMHAA